MVDLLVVEVLELALDGEAVSGRLRENDEGGLLEGGQAASGVGGGGGLRHARAS